MILEQLSVANYRGFEQIDLMFDPKITVIAGVNGVGKSGILYALTTLFAHALPEFTPARKQKNPPTFSDDDVLHGRSTLSTSMKLRQGEVIMQSFGTKRQVEQEQ